ncbi:MAG: hypothetical protein JWR52_1123 [Marmoricola sp.]|nr:hypothetical protein [Marmoricola sp.]
MKAAIAGITAIMLTAALAACGATSSGGSQATSGSAPGGNYLYTAAKVKGGVPVKAVAGWKPLHVAMFGYCACNSYTQSETQGMQRALDQLHNGSTLTFFDGKYSPTTQNNQIENAITSQKYNAFVVLPIDGASAAPAVRQAVQAGIKVGQASFPLGPGWDITDHSQVPGVVMSLLNSPTSDGKITGARTNVLCQGKSPCNVVVMTGPRSVPSEALRYGAVKAQLGSNVKIVSTCDGQYTASGGFTCMQDALQLTKNIDVVMSPSSDSELVGAQKALTAAGIKLGDQNAQGLFKFVGLGASQAAVTQIRAGLWDSSATWLGYPTLSTIMTMALYANVNGHGSEWPPAFNLNDISPIGSLADKESLANDPSYSGEWCC